MRNLVGRMLSGHALFGAVAATLLISTAAFAAQTEGLIKKIDKTLQLIEDEEYGWCESCGVEIGVKRLEARPTADMCVDCKTLAEIKEKQVGK